MLHSEAQAPIESVFQNFPRLIGWRRSSPCDIIQSHLDIYSAQKVNHLNRILMIRKSWALPAHGNDYFGCYHCLWEGRLTGKSTTRKDDSIFISRWRCFNRWSSANCPFGSGRGQEGGGGGRAFPCSSYSMWSKMKNTPMSLKTLTRPKCIVRIAQYCSTLNKMLVEYIYYIE